MHFSMHPWMQLVYQHINVLTNWMPIKLYLQLNLRKLCCLRNWSPHLQFDRWSRHRCYLQCCCRLRLKRSCLLIMHQLSCYRCRYRSTKLRTMLSYRSNPYSINLDCLHMHTMRHQLYLSSNHCKCIHRSILRSCYNCHHRYHLEWRSSCHRRSSRNSYCWNRRYWFGNSHFSRILGCCCLRSRSTLFILNRSNWSLVYQYTSCLSRRLMHNCCHRTRCCLCWCCQLCFRFIRCYCCRCYRHSNRLPIMQYWFLIDLSQHLRYNRRWLHCL